MLLFGIGSTTRRNGGFNGSREAPFGKKDPIESVINQLQGLASKGQWRESAGLAYGAAEQAKGKGRYREASRLYYAACRANYMIYEFGAALRSALSGRTAALSANALDLAAVNSFGLAQVYFSTKSYDLAEQAGRQMLHFAEKAVYRIPDMWSLMGAILAKRGMIQESMTYYRLALAGADQAGDTLRASAALEQIGQRLIVEGRIDEAESYLVEAYRLRRMHGPWFLGWSYSSLAKLRRAQGRYEEALRLTGLCLKEAPAGMRLDSVYFDRALDQISLGDKHRALEELRQAARLARRLRLHMPFGDALQMSFEGDLQNMYSLYVDTAVALHEETGDPRYAEEAFDAAQDNRAASLRARIEADDGWRRRLPPSYWDELTVLRKLELASFHTGGQAASQKLLDLRAKIVEGESLAGLDRQSREEPVMRRAQLRARLRQGEALLGFHLGAKRSYLWVLDKVRMRVFPLAPSAVISSKVRAFLRAVEDNDPVETRLGAGLYRDLFGGLGEAKDHTTWTIIPDEVLFELPFSALVAASGQDRPVRLIEVRAVRLAPSAFLVRTPDRARAGEAFIAAADPISNPADPRFTLEKKRDSSASSPSPGDSQPVYLPRLAGSAAEAHSCAAIWRGSTRLLTGAAMNPINLRTAIEENPRVLHLATHVYQTPGNGRSPVILLGLTAQGQPDVLTDAEIMALGRTPDLVTLSGCGSGRGAFRPGTGLLGLTRAWLMAGTQAVVASLWPVDDNSGALFSVYYQTLQALDGDDSFWNAAQALRKAQTGALGQPGGRTHPSHWSTYFVIGAI